MGSIVRKLAEITDEGLFERLATAVLRQVPEYAALLHPGVNADGKTIRAPVDGICFVPNVDPPQMIVAQHTTCKKDDLREKWLHDPATVKTRTGRSPTKPAGDLVKTAKIVADERERCRSLRAKLILTTNQEPTEDLARETFAAGLAVGIGVEIWSVSRLAHQLDNTPSGQWIRYEFFGVQQELLSPELLAKLSHDSLSIHAPENPALWISRELDRTVSDAAKKRAVTFIDAESGTGKSVTSYKYLAQHVAAGGYGLIITDQVLDGALTIERAIDAALHELHPSLTQSADVDALSLCTVDRPLILVAEDINRSGRASLLAEKLSKWGSRGDESKAGAGASDERGGLERWRLLCPIWPQTVASMGDVRQKQLQQLALIGGIFTPAEGRKAVQQRAKLANEIIDSLEADGISGALGHDPLLIALLELGETPRAEIVIEEFIDRSLARSASKRGEFTAADYRQVLRLMAGLLLSGRELNPSWSRLLSWLGNNETATKMLRYLVHDAEIIRLLGTVGNESLAFRHDRVRDVILADAIAATIQNGSLTDDLLIEPHFAEVIGAALLHDGVTEAVLAQVREHNPLALFHALRISREPTSQVQRAIVATIDLWLADEKNHKPQNAHLRLEALAALSRTESTEVCRLVREFKESSWSSWEAMLRNGDVMGGVLFCLNVPPGMGATSRDHHIEHAKTRFGSKLRIEVDRILRDPNLKTHWRVGALRLAGCIADPLLAEAVEASWGVDGRRDEHLGDYLWAGAQCCHELPERVLGPACDAWAALPDNRDENGHSPRELVISHELRWAFRQHVPVNAIGYFIERARDPDLQGLITAVLHELDHPDAVEYVVRQLAELDRRCKMSGGFHPFLVTASEDWSRLEEIRGRPISLESRERLLALWRNRSNDEHIRKQAFRFWASTKADGDLDILRGVDGADFLADSALWERLKRSGDGFGQLLSKLKGGIKDRAHWWQLGRYFWCPELTEALKVELATRAAEVERKWGSHYGTDYHVYQLIMALPAEKAEVLLLEHWDHLRFSNLFVQTALYAATPQLLEKVRQAVNECPDPRELFTHISLNYGIDTMGREEIKNRRQVEALVPYLDFFDDLALLRFSKICNQRGWLDLRRQSFDERLRGKFPGLSLGDTEIFSSLDQMVDRQFSWVDPWVDRYLESGASRDEVITTVGKWLAARKTIAALELASRVVVYIGRRQDLHILDVAIEPKEAAVALLTDTAFAVKRRSLY
jgi:hypothetical protein